MPSSLDLGVRMNAISARSAARWQPSSRDAGPRGRACGRRDHLVGCDECVCTARHRMPRWDGPRRCPMVSETGWSLHPDRALPSDPGVRPIAREILAATATLPIVSMHGHVDAGVLARDEPFADPASLLVTPDHYLVRMLVSQGVPHDALGVPAPGPAGSRPRTRARSGARSPPTGRCSAGRPRATGSSTCWSRCSGWTSARPPTPPTGCTTCSPSASRSRRSGRWRCSTRSGSRSWPPPTRRPRPSPTTPTLADRGWGDRIVPTFRPDALLHVDRPGWRADVALLEERSGVERRRVPRPAARARGAPARRSSRRVRGRPTTGTSPRTPRR